MTAGFSVLAVLFFVLLMRRLAGRDGVIASLALAFTPIVFVNSTCTVDYLLALAFMLGALYAVATERPALGGVLLGLAIGCRITSGALLLPLAMMVMWRRGRPDRQGLSSALRLSLAACGIGFICFLPVLWAEGARFVLTFHDAPYPPAEAVARRATVGLWGQLGTLALLASPLSFVLCGRRRETSLPASLPRYHPVMWMMTIGLYLLFLLRLPVESGYLIRAVPFVILLLAWLLPRAGFVAVCVALILSSFVRIPRDLSPATALEALRTAPIVSHYLARKEGMAYAKRLASSGSQLPDNSVLIAWAWQPWIYAYAAEPDRERFVYLLSAAELKSYSGRGYDICYLPGLREVNIGNRGTDPADYGAVEVDIRPP